MRDKIMLPSTLSQSHKQISLTLSHIYYGFWKTIIGQLHFIFWKYNWIFAVLLTSDVVLSITLNCINFMKIKSTLEYNKEV